MKNIHVNDINWDAYKQYISEELKKEETWLKTNPLNARDEDLHLAEYIMLQEELIRIDNNQHDKVLNSYKKPYYRFSEFLRKA